MGYTWEVSAWVERDVGHYHYVPMYQGESFLCALVTMFRLKHSGCGCVKLKWR